MPDANPQAMDFLLTRRSRPAKTLNAPAPDRAALEPILRAALRTPDHGKLEPWRLIVLEAPACARLAGEIATHAEATGIDADTAAKGVGQFSGSPLCVAVIESPKASDKIPAIEQTWSAGAVALALTNAALASGWGANWLTGWVAHDTAFGRAALGLAESERVVGFIHIGTESSAPPERPRPDMGASVRWVSA